MKGISSATFAVVSALLFASPAKATCSVSSPINAGIAIDAVTEIHNGGSWDGTYDLQGTAVCEQTADQALAVAAALSAPAWLGDKENFSLSGGLGFSDGETAIGATGLLRFNQTLSGYLGGATSTDGDAWAGKAGLRIGW